MARVGSLCGATLVSAGALVSLPSFASPRDPASPPRLSPVLSVGAAARMPAADLSPSSVSLPDKGHPAAILLVAPASGDSPILRRLRAELLAFGFSVVDYAGVEAVSTPELLVAQARQKGAMAGLRVTSDRGSVGLWIADASTGKTVLHSLSSGPSDAGGEVLALQAAELLRAALLDLFWLRRQVQPAPLALSPPPLPVPLPGVPSSSRHPVALQLGSAGLFRTGVGPALDLLGSVRVHLYESLGLRVLGLAPLLATSVARSQGRAEILASLVGIGWELSLLPLDSDVAVRVGLSEALLLLHADAIAVDGYVASSDTTETPSTLAACSFAYRWAPSLWLTLDLLGGLATPAPTVYFEAQPIATWGRPWLGAALGVEVSSR